jgi:catechol-2,3-dioxygenase
MVFGGERCCRSEVCTRLRFPSRQLQKAETFYRDVLGLEVGLRDERRKWLFLRTGGAAGMVVLQEHDGAFPSYHFAFTVNESDLERAATVLRDCGVVSTLA